ncbi:MAG: peroxiredoxin [Actinomycetota bacterium]
METTGGADEPRDLPAPEDDGACDHLPGTSLPSLGLLSTSGREVRLSDLPGRSVVFCYPRTAGPGEELPVGWDLIPGARGCTPETCSFRDHHDDFTDLGVSVFGLSTQTTGYQEEMVGRLGVRFDVLSDARLALTNALGLPTFRVEGMTLVKRLTLVIEDGTIGHVFYPVFPPGGHAAEVLTWLLSN